MLYVDCWKYDGVLFREEAAPLEAENLLQIVNENSNWNGRLMKLIICWKAVFIRLESAMQIMRA